MSPFTENKYSHDEPSGQVITLRDSISCHAFVCYLSLSLFYTVWQHYINVMKAGVYRRAEPLEHWPLLKADWPWLCPLPYNSLSHKILVNIG